MSSHWDQYKGKVVPLDVALRYIFNNHEHREEDGIPVVESLPLEKFLIEQSLETEVEYGAMYTRNGRDSESYIRWSDNLLDPQRQIEFEKTLRGGSFPPNTSWRIVKRLSLEGGVEELTEDELREAERVAQEARDAQ